MSYEFHAPPTIANLPGGKIILGVTPPVPYTPELFVEMQEQYDQRVREHQALEASMRTKEVEVVSNSNPNKKYVVTIFSDGKMSCDCKGYSFRRSCSHIDKVKSEGDSNGK